MKNDGILYNQKFNISHYVDEKLKDPNLKLKFGNILAKIYVSVIRGTPVILQLMIIYYVIFKSVNINIIFV